MKFALSFLLMFQCGLLLPQSIERQLIGSTGFSAQLNNVGLDCTVGEPMISFTITENNMLSQGFLQPEISDINHISETEAMDIAIFPNPADDHFVIQSKTPLTHLTMYDSGGRIVLSLDLNTTMTEITPTAWAQGLYHLKIITANMVYSKNILIL